MAASATVPVLPFTRAVYVAGVCLTAGTGVGLFAVPDRTEDYWAWTIKAPLTAAFFGAGYIGAALSLALAARTREWERTRVVAVAALTLTTLALVATLRDIGSFAFGDGGLTEAVAWIWLAVYVSLPPLVLAVFVLQERAGRSHDDGRVVPALVGTRVAVGGAGAVLAVVGILLFVGWHRLLAHWAWPLPPLPATVTGGWLCTYAAAFLWFAMFERDWSRVRIGIAPAALSIVLDFVAAWRFSDDFGGRHETAAYLGGLTGLLLVLAAAAWVEERRLRVAVTSPAPVAP